MSLQWWQCIAVAWNRTTRAVSRNEPSKNGNNRFCMRVIHTCVCTIICMYTSLPFLPLFHYSIAWADCWGEQQVCSLVYGSWRVCQVDWNHCGRTVPHGFHAPDRNTTPSLNWWLLENWSVPLLTVAGRISGNRFREPHHYLHFIDNSTLAPPGTPGYDRLVKVWRYDLDVGWTSSSFVWVWKS